MSYILDALRKADAERERDPARGIHAQPVPLPAASEGSSPLQRVLAAVAVVGIAAVATVLLWPAAPVPAPVPVVQVPPPPAPVPLPVAPAQAVQPPPPPAEEKVASVQAAAKPAPKPQAVASTVPVAATAAAAPNRVVAVSELPADVQRELPKLPITGGVYSENAAQRMLIVSGQVMNEGAELAPGLVLEQIRAKSAVMRFRGWRYAVPY
jgi:general secretion pathway protein B